MKKKTDIHPSIYFLSPLIYIQGHGVLEHALSRKQAKPMDGLPVYHRANRLTGPRRTFLLLDDSTNH